MRELMGTGDRTDRDMLVLCIAQFHLLSRMASASHLSQPGKGRVSKWRAVRDEALAAAKTIRAHIEDPNAPAQP